MTSTTTSQTISKLRSLFAAYGFPEEIVSDNGPQFVSQEFAAFLSRNSIRHTKTPPYHAISNGAAERLVQTTKKALLKQVLSLAEHGKQQPLQEGLDSFLMSYRNTPHSLTGKTPAELFLRRQPRVKLSFLKPSFVQDMTDKQRCIKQQRDKDRGCERAFAVGERVFVKCVRSEDTSWDDGTVVQVVSPVTYLVRVTGQVRFVHADHLRPSFARPASLSQQASLPSEQPRESPGSAGPTVETTCPEETSSAGTNAPASPPSPAADSTVPLDASGDSRESSLPANDDAVVPPRRSQRMRRPPDWFRPSDFKK